MRSATKGIRIWGFACLVLAAAAPSFPNPLTGRILGEVRDQSGAALAGASVTVTDVQRATKRTVAADESGAYVFQILLRVSTPCEPRPKASRRSNGPMWTVEVATDVTVDVALPPGKRHGNHCGDG